MKTIKRTHLVCALALALGCASTGGGKPKGPEDQPVEEGEGGAAKAKSGPKQGLTDIAAEPAKPKTEVSKDTEDAYVAAVDQTEKLLQPPLTEAKCKQAADVWSSIADRNPKVASARYNEGLAYEKCNMHKDAERAYKKALDINSRYANALGGLGVIAWKQGNKQQAESYFKQALAIDQRCLPANVNMAALLRERFIQTRDGSAVAEAQDDVRRALAVDGKNMAAYTTLTLLYLDLAGNDKVKLEMAETVLAQAMKISDKYAPLWNASGLVALKKKNVTRALRDFRRAVELEPNFVEAHMNIGAIALSFRDYTSAEQSFRTVLKNEPKNVDATIGLGVALRGQRKIKEAEEQYQAAAKLDPRNCAVPYNLGLLYQDYMSGAEAELRKAQGFYREFLNRCSNNKEQASDAERRTRNIDETFKAMAEAKQLEEEAKRIEAQQKAQEAAQKAQEAAQKKEEPAPQQPAPVSAPEKKAPKK